MTLLIVLGSILAGLAYLTAGFLFSRKYHALHAIEWEKGYLQCEKCHNGYRLNDRNWHRAMHEGDGYIYASIFMVPFWILMVPMIWASMRGASIAAFYFGPVNAWTEEQQAMKTRIQEMKRDMQKMTAQEREIYQLAIDGLEEKVVRKVN